MGYQQSGRQNQRRWEGMGGVRRVSRGKESDDGHIGALRHEEPHTAQEMVHATGGEPGQALPYSFTSLLQDEPDCT
eukprot:7379552-Pyramimonas_sp.AAC.1